MTDDVILQISVHQAEDGRLSVSIDKKPKDIQWFNLAQRVMLAEMRKASLAAEIDFHKRYGLGDLK